MVAEMFDNSIDIKEITRAARYVVYKTPTVSKVFILLVSNIQTLEVLKRPLGHFTFSAFSPSPCAYRVCFIIT